MPMLTLDPHLEKLVTFDHTINVCTIFETKNVRYNLVTLSKINQTHCTVLIPKKITEQIRPSSYIMLFI